MTGTPLEGFLFLVFMQVFSNQECKQDVRLLSERCMYKWIARIILFAIFNLPPPLGQGCCREGGLALVSTSFLGKSPIFVHPYRASLSATAVA